MSLISRGILSLLAAWLVLSQTAFADEKMHLILHLQKTADDKVVSSIAVWANDIDPNSISRNDTYRLEIDGTPVQINDKIKTILRGLDYNRRAYNRDHFTEGLTTQVADARCLLGGPAVGNVLSTLYLTGENFKHGPTEMRPVYSERSNCLFTRLVRPNSDRSLRHAAQALARLEVLRTLLTP